MQDRVVKDITSIARAIIFILLICTIFIAKSLFLILFLTILTLIIIILSNYSVNRYRKLLKKCAIWLLFIPIIYIIIYNNTNSILIFAYKSMMVIALIDNFLYDITFGEVHNIIYSIIYPLKRTKFDIEEISFRMTVNLFFVKSMLLSGNKIVNSQLLKNKVNYNVKNFLMPRLMIAINETTELEQSLIIKSYTLNKDKNNINSDIMVILFASLFIISVFKEVIM